MISPQRRKYLTNKAREYRQKERDAFIKRYLPKVRRDFNKGYRIPFIAERHNLTVRKVHVLLGLYTGKAL